jgi:hypothetical protein
LNAVVAAEKQRAQNRPGSNVLAEMKRKPEAVREMFQINFFKFPEVVESLNYAILADCDRRTKCDSINYEGDPAF